MRLPKKFLTVSCHVENYDIIRCSQLESQRSKRALSGPWPNGKISYSFEELPAVIHSKPSKWSITRQEAIERIRASFSAFHMLTFESAPKEIADLLFKVPSNPYECSATVGHSNLYRAFVYLGASEDCWSKGIILHELGHVAGMSHTQDRTDRHEYLNFITSEKPFEGSLFFDFRSIMIYPLDFLKATLTTKGRTRMELQKVSEDDVGRASSLSRLDLELLMSEYGKGAEVPAEPEDTTSYLVLLWVVAAVSVLLVAAAVFRHRKISNTNASF